MFATRLTAVVFLLLTACTGWDSSTPSYTQPPVEDPVPSHYAPPPPEAIEPPTADDPRPTPPGDRVAIASVMLFDDCPDPAAPDGPSHESARPGEQNVRAACHPSMVQMAARSDRSGLLRIEAVRVLDPASKRVVGSSTLREPSHWRPTDQTYAPWDQRVTAGTDHRVSYKLGRLDFSQANQPGLPYINTYFGPFILEIDVTIDGRRQTIRSPEFGRDEPDEVVT